MRRPHAVPARPRPPRALEAVPPAEGQDAGLHRSRGRPLPHPDDPHARDDRDLARRRPGAAAQRGSRRGDRPRPRHGSHAVRPRGRAGARRRAERARSAVASATTSSRGASRGGSTSPTRSATASSRTRGRRSRRRSRARSCASSTASPTSTTTSTTRSATASSSEADLPRAEIELLGATGSERIDRLVHDLVETSEEAGDIRQSDEIGEAMLSLRAFMFDRVYLGPQVGPEHRRAHDVVQRDLRAARRRSRAAAARRRRARRADHRLRLRHDRPLRARVRRRLVVARIKDKSVRDVDRRRPTSSRSSGCGRRCARARGTRYMGRCPFHEERSPSFSVNSDLNLYHCFGCGKGGDVVTFVRETEGLDFVGAIEWLAERFRVPLEYEESSPLADESRRRRERLFAVLDQAAVVLRAPPLGGRRRASRCARISRAAGSARRSRRSSGSASRRARASRRRRARRASRPTSCAPRG